MAARKERQSNIELLRILAMCMIIGLHYLDKGEVLPSVFGELSSTGYVAWLLEALCFASVNVFFLISGYFAAKSTFSFRKLWNLWLQIFMYSFGIGAVATIVSGEAFDIYKLMGYVFPVVTNHYWFATVYVLLYLISPVLKAGFAQLDQKTAKIMIVILLLVLSVSKSVLPMQLAIDGNGYDLAWMLCVYVTGMYIQKYGLPKLSKWIWLSGYLGSSLIMLASMMVLRTIYLRTGSAKELITYGFSYNFYFCFLASVCLFEFFLQIQIATEKKSDMINKIASVSFAIYLFHEHTNLRYVWPKAFGCEVMAHKGAGFMLLHMVLTIAVLYGLGYGVEMLRRAVIHPIQNKSLLLKTCLFLYTLRNCFWGLDLMDTGYALGNYRYFDTLNQTWKLATYLSNVVGRGLSLLPLGDTWVGMNLYTSALIGAAALYIYQWLQKRYPEKEHMIFIGEILALSLCWAPSTILYHYLGYLIISIVPLLLMDAIEKNSFKKYVFCGVLLGIALFVRMPNITYVALIFPTVYGIYLVNKGKADCAKQILRGFLACVIGYFVSVAAIYLLICVKYGWNAYPDMIQSLFGMTKQATDYKPTSMLTNIFGTYMMYLPWLLILSAYLLAGYLFFRYAPKKLEKLGKAGYILGSAVLLRFLYGRGFFGIQYNDFFSVYKWCVVYITIVIIYSIYMMVKRSSSPMQKMAGAFLIILIFVIPLGGNNGVYSVINSMFLILPLSLIGISKDMDKSRSFAHKYLCYWYILCMTIQVLLFGNSFVFHDFEASDWKAKYTECTEASITGSKTTTGLWTTKEKAEQLDELGKYLSEQELLHKSILTYDNLPSLAYIFDMEPAIFTTWPDLDSNTIERIEEDLNSLKETPVIITSKEVGKELLMEQNISAGKVRLLYDYISKHHYHCSFFNDSFYVFVAK